MVVYGTAQFCQRNFYNYFLIPLPENIAVYRGSALPKKPPSFVSDCPTQVRLHIPQVKWRPWAEIIISLGRIMLSVLFN